MRENLIRRKLEEGKTLMGMGVFTGSPVIIEMIGYSGFDFIFLETEHTAVPIATELRNLITAANSAGLGVICRVKYNDEVMIRQAFEFGADAVVVPHCRTAEDVRKMIRAAKFPPLGVRGAASDVRAAHYGCDADFNYQEFLKKTNEDTLCIALAEDPEFFDNMEEILSVPGLSAVSLGPSDLSLALGNPDTYNLDMPEVKVRFEKLYQAAREWNNKIHRKGMLSYQISGKQISGKTGVAKVTPVFNGCFQQKKDVYMSSPLDAITFWNQVKESFL